MHQAESMSLAHTPDDALEQAQRLVEGKATPTQDLLQAGPVDEVHQQRRLAVQIEHVGHGHHVRVPQPRLQLALADGPRPHLGVGQGDDLEGVDRVQGGVADLVDGAHAPLPEEGQDLVALDCLSDLQQRHPWSRECSGREAPCAEADTLARFAGTSHAR